MGAAEGRINNPQYTPPPIEITSNVSYVGAVPQELMGDAFQRSAVVAILNHPLTVSASMEISGPNGDPLQNTDNGLKLNVSTSSSISAGNPVGSTLTANDATLQPSSSTSTSIHAAGAVPPVMGKATSRAVFEGLVGRSTTHIDTFEIEGVSFGGESSDADVHRDFSHQVGSWRVVEELMGAFSPVDRLCPEELAFSALSAMYVQSIIRAAEAESIPILTATATISFPLDISVEMEAIPLQSQHQVMSEVTVAIQIRLVDDALVLPPDQLQTLRHATLFSLPHQMLTRATPMKCALVRSTVPSSHPTALVPESSSSLRFRPETWTPALPNNAYLIESSANLPLAAMLAASDMPSMYTTAT